MDLLTVLIVVVLVLWLGGFSLGYSGAHLLLIVLVVVVLIKLLQGRQL